MCLIINLIVQYSYLCLVSDEVDLRLGGLRGRRCRDHDIRLLFRLLHQYVDKGLLLVLRLHWDDRCGRGRWSRCLDKHDLVVLLRGWHIDLFTRSRVLVVRGRYVHVHMLVHYGLLLRRAVLRRGRTVRRRGCAVRAGGSTVRRRRLRPRNHAHHRRQQRQRSQNLHTNLYFNDSTLQ